MEDRKYYLVCQGGVLELNTVEQVQEFMKDNSNLKVHVIAGEYLTFGTEDEHD